MNHYKARELREGDKHLGLWHYTVCNNGVVSAVGDCSPYVLCPTCKATEGMHDCKACAGKGLQLLAESARCPGHPTPELACLHYKQYLLRKVQVAPITNDNPRYRCESAGCRNDATHVASIHFSMVHKMFCQQHANKDELAKLFEVGESWGS